MSILTDIASEEHKMEMTPMIDVTFLLLIFFLCTLKFKLLEGKLQAYLPKDVGVNQSEAEPKEKVEISIKLVAEGTRVDPHDAAKPWGGKGRFDYIGRKVTYAVGPFKTEDLEALQTRLQKIYASDPERPSTIAALAGTVYGDVVPVLDRAVEVGYTDITFVGESLAN